jgi:hypothetical protein
MANKKGQIGLINAGLIDASTIPRWILYPLLIIIMLVLLCSVAFMAVYAYSCLVQDKCFMPFGYYGYGRLGGFPVGVIHAQTSEYSECFTNGVKVNCTGGLG